MPNRKEIEVAAYVIMKTFDSPIAIVIPSPHEIIVGPRSKVSKRVKELNERATRNQYCPVMIKTGVQYI